MIWKIKRGCAEPKYSLVKPCTKSPESFHVRVKSTSTALRVEDTTGRGSRGNTDLALRSAAMARNVQRSVTETSVALDKWANCSSGTVARS